MSQSLNDRRSRLLGAMPAIAWSASADTFRFNYISPAAEKILGYPAERWIDEPSFWIQHLHPEDRHVAAICHNETLAGRDHELVYRMIAANGRVVWLRDYVNVHRVDGVPVELFGVMVDITRERDAEEAERESRENFRRMVELSPDCIAVQVDGTYVYVNKAFLHLVGAKSEADVVGRPVAAFVDLGRDELHEGESIPYEHHRIRRLDGSPVNVDVAALPLRYDNRNAMQITARDITDRVRAEEERNRAQQALESSEQRYRTLVEDVNDILYALDEEGRFESLSPSFERCTGYAVMEWIGQPFAALFKPRGLAGNGGPDLREYDLVSRSGATLTLEVSSHQRYVGGVPAGTIGMARDVTEHRSISRKLEDAKRMSSLGQVAASLAHEFNNVLMGIQPFVEVIARRAADVPSVGDSVGHITRAIQRGKRASQEILRFANPKDPQLHPIEVRTWMATLLEQLAASLPKSVTLTSAIGDGVHFIRGDAGHLEQVITNLVFNARDALSGSGTIHVGIESAADMVRISVSDDGPGIAPAMLDRIFEPLFTTKRNGTGLGLAIARRLMERQGGTLTAQNRTERGSVFHVSIPAEENALPSTDERVAAKPRVTRVLLVEDDPAVGHGIEMLLNSEGFDTTWIRTATEVCDAARRVQPEIAIIDVNLPDGNGVDLVQLLRAAHTDLPIILSTGHVELSVSDEEKRLLALMKPYEIADLLEAIESVTTAAA